MVTIAHAGPGRVVESRVSAMLKRIQIQHLTLGMYLHEFCGS